MKVRIENFTVDELKCRCCGRIEYDNEFIVRLQAFRYMLNSRFRKDVPLLVSSGYRCDRHNREVGGVPNSRHLISDAADIRSSVIISDELYREAIRSNLFSTVIHYTLSRFVHVDTRPRPHIHAWEWGK